jgi:hypothetical protein
LIHGGKRRSLTNYLERLIELDAEKKRPKKPDK